jgi:cytochrome c peroxidase
MSPLPVAPASPGNRWADEPAAAQLGQALFFDAGLSADQSVRCATCHDPAKAFTDGLRVAIGIGATERNAPTLLGAQFNRWWFWDGRRDSQWAQALGPLEAPLEHGFTRTEVARRIASAHRRRYEKVFGALPDAEFFAALPGRAAPFVDTEAANAWAMMTEEQRSAVTQIATRAAKAIEAYERLLLPGEAAIDRYVAARRLGDRLGGGNLSPAAVRGLNLFIGKAKCVLCHSGPLFTDASFHQIGLPSSTALRRCAPEACGPEAGRTFGARAVLRSEFRCGSPASSAKSCPELRHLNPEFEDFIGSFKTPTLRNVGRTAPYMHTGEFADLSEVLTFYNTLPGSPAFGHRELFMRPLLLSTDELAELHVFLASLTGIEVEQHLRQPLAPQ